MGIKQRSSSALNLLQEALRFSYEGELYNITIEFGNSRKLVKLIKTSLPEIYSSVSVGKIVSNRFPISNG